MVHNGTIDLDYRGIVGVILFNFSNEEYVIERGDRITQLIIERCYLPKFIEVLNLPKRKLKEERVCLLLQVLDSFLVFFKKPVKKMESRYPNLRSFEKILYHYETIED